MPKTKFKSEAELASDVSSWMRERGWTTYHEVTASGGSARADIVGTLGHQLWVVECKMSLGFAVMGQAREWAPYAHRVSVAVPAAKHTTARRFAFEAAETFGLGVIEATPPHAWRDPVREPVLPRFIRQPPLAATLRGLLHEDQRNTAPGTNHTAFSTPFGRTARALVAAVKAAGGRLLVSDALARISHHYASTSSARSSLVALANKPAHLRPRVMPELGTALVDGKMYFVDESSGRV